MPSFKFSTLIYISKLRSTSFLKWSQWRGFFGLLPRWFFFLSALLRKVQSAIMSTRSEISDLESRNLQSASKNNLCSVVCMLQWCNRHTSASLKNTSQSTPRFVLARTISYKSKGIRCYDWICMCNCHLKREIKLCSQFATCWTICSTASWN